jgi:hypothetical protein
MGGKGSDEIRSEIRKVTGMIADAPTTDSLVKRYGVFHIIGWELTVEIYNVIFSL